MRSGEMSDRTEAHGRSVERGSVRIESCQEEWQGWRRQGTMLATLKARPALVRLMMDDLRTNKVCFASSTSRTHRRKPNSSTQISNTNHTVIHHCKTFTLRLTFPMLISRFFVNYHSINIFHSLGISGD